MLNPSKNGYRPEHPTINEPGPSEKITSLNYKGDETSHLLREVRPYSEILKNQILNNIQQESSQPVATSTEVKIPSGIIYQDSSVGAAI